MQTQYCFDVPRLRDYMSRVRARGLHRGCAILVGVGPLRSARAAAWMRDYVPGVHIPDAIVERLAASPRPRLEGRRICVEIMQELREIEGVAGVHVMAYRQEESVAELVDASGVLEGRTPWYPRAPAATVELPVQQVST